MKARGWVLLLVVIAGVVASFYLYIGAENERAALRRNLEDAALVAATSQRYSDKERQAEPLGEMIADGWPVHWWEDEVMTRSRVAALFQNEVALKREEFRKMAAPASAGHPPRRW